MRTILTIACLLIGFSTPAATKYIRSGATGSNNGTSWTDAYSEFASVSWVRGDTYYLAGGSYLALTVAPAANGSWVTIKKANATDNGSDSGWSSSYATTTATISGLVAFDNGKVSLNGVTGSGTSGHGIRIAVTNLTGAAITLEYDTSDYILAGLEIQGAGYAASSNSADGIFWNNGTNQKGLVVSNVWVHEVTRNGLVLGAVAGTSFEDLGMRWSRSVISETGGCLDPDQHGQGMQIAYATDSRFLIIEGSLFKNVVGSAMIGFLGGSSARHSDVRIINNVFWISDNATYRTVSPGVIWAHDSAQYATNFLVANNTVYGVGNVTNTGALAQFVLYSTNTTGNRLINNLWQSSYFSATNYGFGTMATNGYYVNTGAKVPTGTPGQIDGASSGLSAPDSGIFTPSGFALNSGATLSEFTDDFTGATRVAPWDIGAYELIHPTATAGTVTVGTLIIAP